MADDNQPLGLNLCPGEPGGRIGTSKRGTQNLSLVALVRLLARHAARRAYADFLKESEQGS